jgi:hypothetical protein
VHDENALYLVTTKPVRNHTTNCEMSCDHIRVPRCYSSIVVSISEAARPDSP